MSNGTIDEAQVEAILQAGQPEVNRYLVTCAIQTQRALDEMPTVIATATAAAGVAYRVGSAEERARLAELWQARERAAGLRSFWATMGKVLAAGCAAAGLASVLINLIL